MTAGRTSWWAKDVAWMRRELVVELGEAFGAAGPIVLDQLNAEAKEQRDGGRVRSGYRHLARECFLTDAAEAKRIVQRAAEIGAVDDFEEDDDGRRFFARVSGFQADQEHARAAARQQAKRDREAGVTERDGGVTERDEGLPTGQDITEQTPSTTTSLPQDSDETVALCNLLASLIVGNDAKANPSPKSKTWRDSARLLLERDGRDYEEAKLVMRWCQADEFWRSNVLSMSKFREKYAQLRLRMSHGKPAPLEQASKSGRERWQAWAAENLPDLPVAYAGGAAEMVAYSGREVTPEAVRARIASLGHISEEVSS